MEAHPRSRGENRGHRRGGAVSTGSSPLTRGKLEHELSDAVAVGLIPAHAGKTSPRVSVCTSTRAHPRSRGENLTAARPCAMRRGSSPLTRGKPRKASICAVVAGAHPRSRGENYAPFLSRASWSGSSPLTRGKRRLLDTARVDRGLIPAHAGKTDAGISTTPSRGAHPRSRGENSQAEEMMRPRTGSSPLTRGKQPRDSGRHHDHRLIPAHAGKTVRDGA